MYISTDKGNVSAAPSVKLPAINGPAVRESVRQVTAPGVNNSSGMVTHNPCCSNSQTLIYRSIPPKPQNYTLSDMLGSGSGIVPPNPVKSKQLGLSGSTSSEFAKRFKSRPTTQPKVIDFSVGRISSEKRRRGINGFFPPVKLRGSAKSHHSSQTVNNETKGDYFALNIRPRSAHELTFVVEFPAPRPQSSDVTFKSRSLLGSNNNVTHFLNHDVDAEQVVGRFRYTTRESFTSSVIKQMKDCPPTQSTNRLQLIPTAYSEVRPKSNTRSTSRASRQSRQSIATRKTPESVRTAPAPEVSVPVYPETFECDDLSILPRPKRILPKRDTPWVFRYKVKKNMNELSKIMASRPQQLVDV